MAIGRRIDKFVVALARRQHGLVTRAQLLDLGLGVDAITYRAAAGQLIPVHLGVYAVGRPIDSPIEHAAAAVLACGPQAILGRASALALWLPGQPWPEVPVVIAADRRRRPGIEIHSARGLIRTDIRIHHGIRVTSPPRSLLDCARELGERTTARLLAEGRRAGLIHPAALDDVLTRFPRHPGRATLLALRDDPAARARSDFEVQFPAFCARHGLPAPLINTRVAGREADAYFPRQRLIVELDGWDFHRDRENFEDDRLNDGLALEAGIATYRMTWRRFVGAAAAEARRLKAILVSRGWSPSARSAPGS